MTKPIFAYWKSQGISQPIRYMLAYLEVDFEEIRLDLDQATYDQWFHHDNSRSGLDFPNLPYWKEDGWNLTESRAILRYLAREKSKSLMPTEPKLVRQADMIENILWEVWNNLLQTCMGGTEELKRNLVVNFPKKFDQLNNFLRSKNYLIGNELSYVDFVLFEVINHYMAFDQKLFKPFPQLERFRENFGMIPAISKYINSPNYIKSPVYHPLFVKYHIQHP